MSPSVLIPQAPYLLAILAAFSAFIIFVRREVLSGARIWQTGIVLAIFAIVVAALNDHRNLHVPPGMSTGIYLLNPGAMAVCAGYCILLSYRMQRTTDLATYALGDTKIIVIASPASKIPDAQALILPNSTSLSMGGGVPGQIKRAAGDVVEVEATKGGPVGIGKVVQTESGSLKVGSIYHVAVYEPSKNVKVDVLKRFFGQALLNARKANVESLCIPLGSYPGLSVVAYTDAILEPILKQRKAFAEIVLVALDPRDGRDIHGSIVRAIKAVEPSALETGSGKNAT